MLLEDLIIGAPAEHRHELGFSGPLGGSRSNAAFRRSYARGFLDAASGAGPKRG